MLNYFQLSCGGISFFLADFGSMHLYLHDCYADCPLHHHILISPAKISLASTCMANIDNKRRRLQRVKPSFL